MRVFVTGNIASGKTTFGKALSKAINLPFIGLDRFRRESQRGESCKISAEEKAKQLCLKKLQQVADKGFIFENTGTTVFFKEIRTLFPDAFHIHLSAEPEGCISRHQTRKRIAPLPFKVNTRQIVYRYDKHYRSESFQPDLILKNCDITTEVLTNIIAFGYEKGLLEIIYPKSA
ncbi:MAG: shikimate kinase [Bacteroidota bacterium]